MGQTTLYIPRDHILSISSDLPKSPITETDTVGRKSPLPTPKMNRNRKIFGSTFPTDRVAKNGDFKSENFYGYKIPINQKDVRQ